MKTFYKLGAAGETWSMFFSLLKKIVDRLSFRSNQCKVRSAMSTPAAAITRRQLSNTYQLVYSNDNLKEVIERVASSVSKSYAIFPLLTQKEKEEYRKDGCWFGTSDQPVSKKECETFESTLKKELITLLTKKEIVHLSTDYAPEKTLDDVCRSVFPKHYQLSYLFPYKTYTWISFKDNQICVRMNFQGPKW